MPSSWPSQISPIMTIILAMAPRTVLDIGPGFGKYGVLCREYLDIVPGSRSSPTYPPPRRIRIDCIEAWPDYVSPLHHYIYDHVYVGDARLILPNLAAGAYDLALFVDVLEHCSAREGRRLTNLALEVAPLLLVATPTTDIPQGASFGNDYERHLSRWTPRELRALAPACRFFRNPPWRAVHAGHICLLSADDSILSHVARRVRALTWVAYRTTLLESLHLRDPIRRLLRRSRLASAPPVPGRTGQPEGG